ncbi:MAG: glucosamine-6-phosphate deaminase [Sporolactobacillus sp.]
MRFIRVKDSEEMSGYAADLIASTIQQQPHSVLGLATGGTPEQTYTLLIEKYKKNAITFAAVRTVNLDEYVGLPSDDPNSYRSYMDKHLFAKIDIRTENCHIPNGEANSIDDECRHYDRLIERIGGIDLQLLGIGQNGHIGFNEPGTPFDSGTHCVTLTDSTRRANARYFASAEDVPKQAITVGIGTILKSKKILLLVTGLKKAEALKQLIGSQQLRDEFPASALWKHANVTVVADQAACALLTEKEEEALHD